MHLTFPSPIFPPTNTPTSTDLVASVQGKRVKFTLKPVLMKNNEVERGRGGVMMMTMMLLLLAS